MTQAQNSFDERFFEIFVNPVLDQLRLTALEQVAPDSSILSMGCGTGEFCAMLAGRCARVTGLDPLEKNVSETKARTREFTRCRIEILQTNYDCCNDYSDNEFDYSVLMMTLHELDWEQRLPVFKEALRVAGCTVIVDYVVPQLSNPHGSIIRTAELLAGRRHFSNFQSYIKMGGLRSLEESLHIEPAKKIVNSVGTTEIVVY